MFGQTGNDLLASRRVFRLMWSIATVRILFLCVVVFYLVSG